MNELSAEFVRAAVQTAIDDTLTSDSVIKQLASVSELSHGINGPVYAVAFTVVEVEAFTGASASEEKQA